MWFPLPDSSESIFLTEGPDGLSAAEVFELVHSSKAVEWRHKVGVAGRRDGSAKTTTRLLLVDGWVAKTDVAVGYGDRESALEVANARRDNRLKSLWHRSKHNFVMLCQGTWLLASLCWELRTLRGIGDRRERFAGWVRMLERCIEVGEEHDLGLDINPSNFGECLSDLADNNLYYIDDEYYPEFSIAAIGQALASRIPEEPESEPEEWVQLAARLQPALSRACKGYSHWSELLAGIEDYPLRDQCRLQREVLVETIRSYARASSRRAKEKRRAVSDPLTCVFADVHGNLPALEAVLAAAKEHGARDYIFLGDVVGYGPHPQACIDRLRNLDDAILIRGNHDHVVGHNEVSDGMNSSASIAAKWTTAQLTASDQAWLRDLPIEYRKGKWLCVHGAPRDPQRFFAYVYDLTYEDNLESVRTQDLRLCFYGHTHVPYVHRRIGKRIEERLGAKPIEVLREQETVLVNPGSVGQPRDGDCRASFALWNRRSQLLTFHRTSYDIAKTIRDLSRTDLPSDLANRLQAGT